MAAGRLWAPQSVHGTGGWLAVVYNNSAVVAAIGKGGASAAVPVEQQTIAKQFVDGRAYFLLLLLNGERSER